MHRSIFTIKSQSEGSPGDAGDVRLLRALLQAVSLLICDDQYNICRATLELDSGAAMVGS